MGLIILEYIILSSALLRVLCMLNALQLNILTISIQVYKLFITFTPSLYINSLSIDIQNKMNICRQLINLPSTGTCECISCFERNYLICNYTITILLLSSMLMCTYMRNLLFIYCFFILLYFLILLFFIEFLQTSLIGFCIKARLILVLWLFGCLRGHLFANSLSSY